MDTYILWLRSQGKKERVGEVVVEGRSRRIQQKEGRCLLTATIRSRLVETAPSTSGAAAAAMTVIVVVV